jgi:hypothetical protein
VQLTAGEYLGAACVTAPRPAGADLQALPGPRVLAPETGVAGTHDIRVTTTRPLYEPMYELQLQIKCPGTALLVRQYVLMLDLPGAVSEASPPAATLPAAIPADSMPTAVATADAPAQQPVGSRAASTRPLAGAGDPIPAGSRYTVRQGDTLSTIAARVQNRSGSSLWQFADRIFAANPAAFIAANPDLIRLGVEIDIPPTALPSATTAASDPATVFEQPSAVRAPVAAYEDTPLPITEPALAAAQTAPEASLVPSAVSGNDPAQSLPQVVSPAPEAADPAAVEQPPSEVAVAEPAESPASPFLAAGLGILVGLGLSFALLRERLTEALRDRRTRRAARGRPVPARVNAAASATAAGAAPAPRVSRTAPPRESSMVVVEEAREEPGEHPAIPEPTARTPALAPKGHPPAQAASLDADLARLFDDDGLSSAASFDPTDVSPVAASADQALDLDLTGAMTDDEQAADIAWVGDETRLAQTQKALATDDTMEENTAEQLDLQALASSADTDEKLSQTLMEALTLLERDYEDELTASQVLDLNKLRDDAAHDDDTTLAHTGTGPRKRR